jgi:PAS domain S-box-containing protein
MDDSELGYEEKRRRALELGTGYLGVENGHVERIVDEETHEIVASVGGPDGMLPEGNRLDRATTYCRRTLAQETTVAVDDAGGNDAWAGDPAYRTHGFDCYLGAPVLRDGERWGTVCFISRDPRDDAFDADERAFVELLARELGRELQAVEQRHRRAAAERERKRSAEKYRTLVEAAPNAIVLAEADTGRIVEANERAVELTGRSQERLLGTPVFELNPAEHRERYADVLRDGDRRSVERFPDGTPFEVERPDGERVPVELSTRQLALDGDTYVQGIFRDISDRRERERELQVKDRAIDEAGVGITIADATDPDESLVYVNDGFCELTGYDRADAVGENCRFLQGSDTDEEAVAEVRAALDANEPVTTELLNYRADGTPFWNELSITPVTRKGRVTHFIGVQQDRTEQRRRDQLIGVLNRVLRHNIRNDMSVVLSSAEFLAESATDGEAAHVRRIRERAESLVARSEKAQALESAVRRDRDLRPVDAVPVVRDAVEQLSGEHGTDVATDCPPAATVLATDRLSDVVTELLENARVHGGDGVRVEVDTEPDGPGTGTDGDRDDCCVVAIRVHDDGPGLPAHEQRALESREETPLDHGSGLGLWLVKWLVTGFGGSVTATVDDGTTVTVRLPTPEEGVERGARWPSVLAPR